MQSPYAEDNDNIYIRMNCDTMRVVKKTRMTVLLKELRETKEWSQATLAAHLKVAPSTVYNWESGRAVPSFLQAREVAHLFGVSMDELEFTESKPPRRSEP